MLLKKFKLVENFALHTMHTAFGDILDQMCWYRLCFTCENWPKIGSYFICWCTLQELASEFLSNYICLSVGKVGSITDLISQRVVYVPDNDKRNILLDLLNEQREKEPYDKVLRFLQFVLLFFVLSIIVCIVKFIFLSFVSHSDLRIKDICWFLWASLTFKNWIHVLFEAEILTNVYLFL